KTKQDPSAAPSSTNKAQPSHTPTPQTESNSNSVCSDQDPSRSNASSQTRKSKGKGVETSIRENVPLKLNTMSTLKSEGEMPRKPMIKQVLEARRAKGISLSANSTTSTNTSESLEKAPPNPPQVGSG
ncbi:hypothetical protein PIB30_039473, partial [Stylosanthes scabra]|nr:hypothetical protein [Stylosanthes scabra]